MDIEKQNQSPATVEGLLLTSEQERTNWEGVLSASLGSDQIQKLF
jgi:hypothetical protein